MKTILFLGSGNFVERRGFGEILRFARENQWRIRIVPYSENASRRYELAKSSVAADISGLLEFWHPDGCIVECSNAPTTLQPEDFGDTPVVFMDRDPTTVSGRGVCVVSDANAVAEAAFQELCATGMRNFAYAGWYDPVPWSVNRRLAFEKLLKANGFPMHELKTLRCKKDPQAAERTLLRSLNESPRPLAVFAANDMIAEFVINVCCHNGISVPRDVAVVGVDNVGEVCENAIVSITSVPQDYERLGWIACETLQLMLRTHRRRVKNRKFGVEQTIRRASTRMVGVNRRLGKALEFIRQNADYGVTVNDVVKVMECSRRMADLIFRREVGHSILSEITTARMEKAKALLKRRLPVAVVADMCGYGSVNDFDRVFKRCAGVTPNVWRKNNLCF